MKKKCIVEFGRRGGNYTSGMKLITLKQGRELASTLVHVLRTKHDETNADFDHNWEITADCPRQVWVSPTHFVALSILDGVARGPASARYWHAPFETLKPYVRRFRKDEPLFD